MNIHIHRRFIIWPLALLAVGAIVAGLWVLSRQPRTDIRTEQPGVENFAKGKVAEGANTGSTEEIKTTSTLTYESSVRKTKSPSTNAVGIIWEQEGEAGDVVTEIRTNDGSKWSKWVDIGEGEDQKDGQSANVHSGMLLTENAKEVQYRFRINSNGQGSSAIVRKPRISLIDSTRGPDPTKPKPLAKLFGKTAKATADAPQVFSRAQWGCPEATSSPRWLPEYRVPDEAIVHHTAAVTNPSSSAAAVRAIWYQHANAQGWGDIGYNYLVDLNGNIFDGRFHDEAYARSINQDVVGGHTLNGHNFHSVGVAALGNFSEQGVNGPMLEAFGRIIGFKAMPYGNWNPAGRTFGHRDADSTNCPGNNLYANLGTVRGLAANYFDFYSKWQQFDYSFQGEGVNGSPGGSLSLRPGETTTVYLDLKNEGTNTWLNTQVRLGTSRPLDRPSGFRDSSWAGPNRVATFAGQLNSGTLDTGDTTIEPGKIARWQFTVGNQGADMGTYAEYFQPVVEGYTWFIRDRGVHWLMSSVQDVYSYQWVTQSYDVPTEPGDTGTISVDVRNTGNVNWSNGGANPVRIAPNRPNDRTSAIRHSSWLSNNRTATFAGQVNGSTLDSGDDSIEPNSVARFTFTVQAPNSVLQKNEYFNLVAEGKTWMNDIGIHVPMNIGQNYQAQFAGQSSAPTIDKSDGGIGSLYFDYRNTGTYPWRKTDNIVRLAPNRPNDRSSTFFATGLSGGQLPTNTANWLSANRVGSFAGQVNSGTLDTADATIEPGQIGRFMVALDARNVNPGTYNEYFNVVADGFAWMQDVGVFLPVTVVP